MRREREIESIDDSAALVAQVDAAIHDRQPLHIRGAGTKAFVGRAVEGRSLDVRTHRGIVAYDPTELVITARAGTPLADLEAMLDAAGQMIRMHVDRYDVPLPAHRIDVLIDMVVRLVLSHVMQPTGEPAETASTVAWIAARVLDEVPPA